jgi:hypothetical protein
MSIKQILLGILGIIPNALVWLWGKVPDRITLPIEGAWYSLAFTVRLRIQKGATDFWTYFLIGVSVLTVGLPDKGDWKNWLIALGLALGGIALNAARRVWQEAA